MHCVNQTVADPRLMLDRSVVAPVKSLFGIVRLSPPDVACIVPLGMVISSVSENCALKVPGLFKITVKPVVVCTGMSPVVGMLVAPTDATKTTMMSSPIFSLRIAHWL